MASMFTDAEIVAFAQLWDPYGGPEASEVFLQFGCAVEVYQDRLKAALEKIDEPDPARRTRMIEYTRKQHSNRETPWTPH